MALVAEEFCETVDVFFMDEAWHMSLAEVLAVSQVQKVLCCMAIRVNWISRYSANLLRE
ncbi:hypothetical protein L0244_08780 [bacterium]|nr:hypothetical protein [bacterium]